VAPRSRKLEGAEVAAAALAVLAAVRGQLEARAVVLLAA
jgi:hypothetical protein